MYQCALYGKGQLMSQDASGEYIGTAATDRIYQTLVKAAREVLTVECAGDVRLLVTILQARDGLTLIFVGRRADLWWPYRPEHLSTHARLQGSDGNTSTAAGCAARLESTDNRSVQGHSAPG